jgi:hypothetical protein
MVLLATLFFPDRISLLVQACLELTITVQMALTLVILLPQPPECWDYRYVPPCLVYLQLLTKRFSQLLNLPNFFAKSLETFCISVVMFTPLVWEFIEITLGEYLNK